MNREQLITLLRATWCSDAVREEAAAMLLQDAARHESLRLSALDWAQQVKRLEDEREAIAAKVARLQDVFERAKRLVEHADFKLGGCLSADSKAKEIPSNAVSNVKSRHLASLRDSIEAARAALKDTA